MTTPRATPSTSTVVTLVQRRPGLLARVTNLLRRRSFDVISLTVGRTQRPDLARMTLVVGGPPDEGRRLGAQLSKLVDVVRVDKLSLQSVERDLALFKVASTTAEARRQIHELCELFRGRVVDVSPNSLIVEITGSNSKIEQFSELVEPLGLLEMARTEIVAMGRGDQLLDPGDHQMADALCFGRTSVL